MGTSAAWNPTNPHPNPWVGPLLVAVVVVMGLVLLTTMIKVAGLRNTLRWFSSRRKTRNRQADDEKE
jgi:hypothetical protein